MTKEPQGLPQDTLVTEILPKLEDQWLWQKDELEYIDPLCKQAAALIRSLSEANAALTQEWREAVQGEYNRAEHHKLIRETAEAALSIATAEIERLKGALIAMDEAVSNATVVNSDPNRVLFKDGFIITGRAADEWHKLLNLLQRFCKSALSASKAK